MWRRIATVHERLGRFPDALDAWSRVRALDRITGNPAGEAEAVEGLGRAERHLSRPAGEVIERYEEALALAIRLGDRRRELAVRNSLGIVHWQRGAYPDAVRQYEAALRLCREAGDHVHEVLILNSLAATLHKLRRWDEARTALSEAVRVSADTDERQLRAHAYATLGDVCFASGRLDEALQDFEASLALRRELDDSRGEQLLRERIARVNEARATVAAPTRT
jgi:tetratricopeptide (TPR) repeat protein